MKQKIVTNTYSLLLSRLKRWLVPLTLAMVYLTAFTMNDVLITRYIKRIELTTLHALSGFLLGILTLTLLYDTLYRYLKRRKSLGATGSIRRHLRLHRHRFGFPALIDFLFFAMLISLCVQGLIFHINLTRDTQILLKDQTSEALLHTILGWSFISILLAKYYLTLARWFNDFRRYLREF